MTDPTARALIQRLADALESWLQARELGGIPPEDGADAALVIEARAYLATPEPAADGPAVPDGREPASVAAHPTAPTDDELAKTAAKDVLRFVPADLLNEWIVKAGSDLCRIADMAAKWGYERGKNEAAEIAIKAKRDANRRCEANSQTVPERSRWIFSEKLDRMVSRLDRSHVIPLGDSETDLHCASVECWCNPLRGPQPNGTEVCSHNALTGSSHEGWVLIGERIDAHVLPLPEGS